MSIKHFNQYFAELTNQYDQMKANLAEFQSLAQQQIISDEQLKSVEETIKPIADSFNTMAYVKYLLDMPQRKSKQSTYNRQKQKFLQTTKITSETVLANNAKSAIDLEKQLEEIRK